MSTPTKKQVRTEVVRIISTFTTRTPDGFKDDQKLKEPPLLLDDITLGFLAYSLRGYLRQYNEGGTVKVAALRKSGRTVGDVVELIQKEVGVA